MLTRSNNVLPLHQISFALLHIQIWNNGFIVVVPVCWAQNGSGSQSGVTRLHRVYIDIIHSYVDCVCVLNKKVFSI